VDFQLDLMPSLHCLMTIMAFQSKIILFLRCSH
jgi:hypothetical protein